MGRIGRDRVEENKILNTCIELEKKFDGFGEKMGTF